MTHCHSILKIGTENWGADSPVHAIRKEANWLEFVQLVPNKDHIFEKDMAKLKQKLLIDEFLKKHNEFLEISNEEVNCSFSFNVRTTNSYVAVRVITFSWQVV